MRGRDERAHVYADLGDDGDGIDPFDPRDTHQQAHLPVVRRDHLCQRDVEALQIGLGLLDAGQLRAAA